MIEKKFTKEHEWVSIDNKIFLALNAHIVTPIDKYMDCYMEENTNQKIGTTGRGIGPTYVKKYNRVGIRSLDLLNIENLTVKVKTALRETQKLYNLHSDEIKKIQSQINEFINCTYFMKLLCADLVFARQ